MKVLSASLQQQIRGSAAAFWAAHVATPEFAAVTAGKEVGHSAANYVDDRTAAHLSTFCDVEYQLRGDGTPSPRSQGDFWVVEDGVRHPVNVKFGLAGSESRPNVVSLKKVAAALAEHQIDSYWLLFVKVDRSGDTPTAEVDFVDLFDFLDYVAFDSGTGQLMLKAKEFIDHRANGGQGSTLPAAEVLDRLYTMLEDADRRLIEVRRKKREQLKAKIEAYRNSSDTVVDQSELSFG